LAHRTDLDGEGKGKEYKRSKKFTAEIKRKKISDQKAWDQWGMVNAVKV
jgi:hypothetical protein